MDKDQCLRRHAELLTGTQHKEFYDFEGKFIYLFGYLTIIYSLPEPGSFRGAYRIHNYLLSLSSTRTKYSNDISSEIARPIDTKLHIEYIYV